MSGKASLLMAAVLFGMGAAGLVLTTGDSARWGPFQPGPAKQQQLLYRSPEALFAQSVIVLPQDGGLSVPVAVEPTQPPVTHAAVLAEAPGEPAPALEPAPTATPPTPLLVHGIAADDGSVQAADAALPPVRIIMVSGDGTDDEAATAEVTPDDTEATPTGEIGPDGAEASAAQDSETPEPATAPADATPSPASD